QSDKRVIRLTVPPLSGERRKQLANQVKQMAEQQRISIRNIRREANKHIDQEQKNKKASEDEAAKGKEEIQELTRKHEEKVGELLKGKLTEIEAT
ncbi:MAG: ribosome recycling factor, partial [Phycisphaerae bacterium]|nr:ribosome recycling factor [Phycisphaerae bacterium]